MMPTSTTRLTTTVLRHVPKLAMLFATLYASTAAAQQDAETYRMRVPGTVSINATHHLTQIVHDESNDPQRFEFQPWQVVCNSVNGATMTMATDQAFTHTTDSTKKRNAFLWLVGGTGTGSGPNDWRVTKEFGLTDYANGNELATVEAETDGASDAEFFLRVTFVEEDFNSTIAGDYECTVTGTIVAK